MIKTMSINRPPYFNGTNYAYWKARIKIFLDVMDMLVWDTVVEDWFKPYKPAKDQTEAEKDVFNANYKALNAIKQLANKN